MQRYAFSWLLMGMVAASSGCGGDGGTGAPDGSLGPDGGSDGHVDGGPDATSFTAQLATSELVIDQGATTPLALTVTRDVGFDDVLTVAPLASFADVAMDPVTLASNASTATLFLEADANATVELPRSFPVSVSNGTTARSLDLELRVRPTALALDASYGFHGVHLETNDALESFRTVACDGAGACFVAAAHGRIRKYTAAGVLDPTFGSMGIAEAGAAFTALDEPMLALGDSQVVSVGMYGEPDARKLVVTRVDADGTLDETFGTSGHLELAVPGTGATPVAVTVRPNSGFTFVVGYVGGATVDVFVARITSEGALDATFDGDGIRIYDLGEHDYPTSLIVSPGLVIGGFQVVGATESPFVLKVNSSGAPDASFDTDGVLVPVVPAPCSEARVAALFGASSQIGVVLSADGADCRAVAFHVSSVGVLDTTYGTDGFARSSFGSTTSSATTGAIRDASGRIVVVGTYGGAFGIGRFTTTGSVDASWGTNGLQTLDLHTDPQEVATSIALDASGRYVVVGGGGHPYGAIACFTP